MSLARVTRVLLKSISNLRLLAPADALHWDEPIPALSRIGLASFRKILRL